MSQNFTRNKRNKKKKKKRLFLRISIYLLAEGVYHSKNDIHDIFFFFFPLLVHNAKIEKIFLQNSNSTLFLPRPNIFLPEENDDRPVIIPLSRGMRVSNGKQKDKEYVESCIN